MVGAFPKIGFHISEKESIRGEKVGIFDLGACKVARSLQPRLAWILEPGLILPNVFGSPTMVAAVFNFKDWAAHLKTRFHQFPSNTPNG